MGHILYIHVSGFDPQQRRSNSFVSLSHDHLETAMWEVFADLVATAVHDSLQKKKNRNKFMDAVSHLIVTLMEAEAERASQQKHILRAKTLHKKFCTIRPRQPHIYW